MLKSSQGHRLLAILVSLLTFTVVLPIPAIACPEETVTYGPFTLHTLSGRILPDEGGDLLPGGDVNFVVHQIGHEDEEGIKITVQANGDFVQGLPEGRYTFSISVEGFLFTLVGEVTIDGAADEAERMIIDAPWC